MPRYYAPVGFKPLRTAEDQTLFLRSLSDEQYGTLQKIAATATAPGVHADAFKDIQSADRLRLIHGLWSEQRGGGSVPGR